MDTSSMCIHITYMALRAYAHTINATAHYTDNLKFVMVTLLP